MRNPILFALLTAMCWGLYGPTLAQARSSLSSPFKPYFLIGIAYIVWAIVGGLIGMRINGDELSFSSTGAVWGLAAGTLGAWGALYLTLAMFTGGAALPHLVMPIVFGGAVTISALVALPRAEHVSPWLWLGIVVVGAGIVLVAYNTPHAVPAGRPAESAESAQAN